MLRGAWFWVGSQSRRRARSRGLRLGRRDRVRRWLMLRGAWLWVGGGLVLRRGWLRVGRRLVLRGRHGVSRHWSRRGHLTASRRVWNDMSVVGERLGLHRRSPDGRQSVVHGAWRGIRVLLGMLNVALGNCLSVVVDWTCRGWDCVGQARCVHDGRDSGRRRLGAEAGGREVAGGGHVGRRVGGHRVRRRVNSGRDWVHGRGGVGGVSTVASWARLSDGERLGLMLNNGVVDRDRLGVHRRGRG